MNKKFAAIGLGTGLAIGAGAGFILEASGSAGAAPAVLAVTASTDAASTDTASTDSTTAGTDAARPDPSTRLQEALQPLIDAGTITQAQADAVIEALVAARPEGMGGPRGGGRHGGRGARLETVATALGITAEEVRAGIEGGQTIAELAVANGKTAQDVIDVLIEEATTRINQAVTDGKITQAEADTKLADVTTRVTEFVNNTPELRGGPGHGPDEAAADDATATTDTVSSAG
jgi:hypothetical protein